MSSRSIRATASPTASGPTATPSGSPTAARISSSPTTSPAGERQGDSDLSLHEDNRDPRGIWSDGDTIYVLDSVKDVLFAYDLDSGTYQAQYALVSLNSSPRGVWSDGVTFWISDDSAKRIFAYRMEDGALRRIEAEEFSYQPLLKAGNGNPRGIWSDRDVVFVADEQDDRVYTYNMPESVNPSLSCTDAQRHQFRTVLVVAYDVHRRPA